MKDMTELIDRYLAVWNEPDAAKRDVAVAEIWRVDAFAASAASQYAGREAIAGRVTRTYEDFVAKQGFVFRAVGDPDVHHEAMRIRWEMAPAAGGPAVSGGVQFLILDAEGRVRYDYQFIDF
jgi:hypothetical protein